MIKLNKYIIEAWSGVKKQSLKQEIEAWCDEMDIENYTINSKGEIDVDGDVWLINKGFKELPYKFNRVTGYFDVDSNKNLISLKNCPDYVEGSFNCSLCPQLDSLEGCPKEVGGYFDLEDCKNLTSLKNCPNYVKGYFYCNQCTSLDSLEGCPKEVGRSFYCFDCKRNFTKEEVESLCKVNNDILS